MYESQDLLLAGVLWIIVLLVRQVASYWPLEFSGVQRRSRSTQWMHGARFLWLQNISKSSLLHCHAWKSVYVSELLLLVFAEAWHSAPNKLPFYLMCPYDIVAEFLWPVQMEFCEPQSCFLVQFRQRRFSLGNPSKQTALIVLLWT